MKRLVNIFKYILFLGVGVGLFYLATLDIIRGTLLIESDTVPFEVSKGHGECSEDGRELRLTSVDDRYRGTEYVIADTLGTEVLRGIFPSGEIDGEDYQVLCLDRGFYTFSLQNPPSDDYSFSLQGVDRTDELVTDMKRASIPGIIASFVFGYLAIVSRGIRWRYLLEPLGYEPKMANSINSVAFAYFANTFVPRSGELARCAALNQSDDIPVDKLFGTVISERVVDMMMLLTFMAVALITNLEAFSTLLEMGANSSSGSSDSGSLFTWIAIVVGVLLAGAIFFRRSIMAGKLYQKAKDFLYGVGDGLKSVLKMKRRGAFIFHTFFIWGMYFAMAYVVYMSIDATSHMSVTQSLFVMVAGGFGMVLPAPGGIGSYHWTVKLGFMALGMSGALGFAVANVLWLTQTVMIVVTGGIGYLLLMLHNFRKEGRKNA